MIKNNLLKNSLDEIKKNKKYKTISDEIIVEEIKKYLEKNKTEEINKEDIKIIRASLHKSYSSFQTKKKNKRYQYLEKLKQNQKETSTINKLLSMVLSTKERLKNYSEIYKKIFSITNTPQTIIDLGSGFNPLSYPYMNLKKVYYFAYDIDEEDINFLNEYFLTMKNQGLNGIAKILDLRNTEKIKKIPKSDIVLLFKVIDILDKENHKISEELIKELINKTRYIVASFATKTITRKFMNYPDRKWFELMLERNNLQYQKFQTENELFYIIQK
ncbi:MAG: hypothetical protein WC438_04505 [Candidatus Pacearchaeota archaeon]